MKIFVYGTLRKGMRNHDQYLKDKSVYIGKGYVKGELYRVAEETYPALRPGLEVITGEIYEVEDEVAVKIDELEGYVFNRSNNLYNKVSMDVFDEEGQLHSCLPVYVWNTNNEQRLVLGSKILENDFVEYQFNRARDMGKEKKYAISSCLMGVNCKYSGGHNLNEVLVNFMKDKSYILVCPEVLGGLPIPRACCEIKDGHVMDVNGQDVSEQFHFGAYKALEQILREHIDQVILQPRSPSCGAGSIYDGSFSKKLVKGDGVFVKLLKEKGIQVTPCDEFLKETGR